MKADTYEELRKTLRELFRERQRLQAQMDENSLSIQEAQCFTKKILDKEDEDFKVFSPRKIEDIYKTELEQYSARKVSLEKQNERLSVERNKLDSMIYLFKKIEEESRDTDEESVNSVQEADTCSRKTNDADLREKNLTAIHFQEEDRRRIARDLHDTALQDLTHLIHKIELSSKFIDQDPVRAKLELSAVGKEMKKVIDEIRGVIYDLRPMSFDDLGLKKAFERMVSVFNEKNCYEMDIQLENVSCENQLVLITIYRVVRECFNNIDKHANAQKILFHCKQEDEKCVIRIEDDGKGFLQEEVEANREKHFGLLLIREYIALLGGELQIDSEPKKGTKIRIEVPLNTLGENKNDKSDVDG